MSWSGVVGDTFRAWFTVDDGKGVPKTGLVSGDFTATVITADDSASQVVTVTESSQVSGLYYFDVPGAFLTTNGVGEYGVHIVVSTAAPTFHATASRLLDVKQQDIDALAGNVWEEATSGHTTAGSFGEAIATVLSQLELLRDYTEGRWHIVNNQMKFYKADNSTLVATFNLFDSSGTPTVDAVFERKKV